MEPGKPLCPGCWGLVTGERGVLPPVIYEAFSLEWACTKGTASNGDSAPFPAVPGSVACGFQPLDIVIVKFRRVEVAPRVGERVGLFV